MRASTAASSPRRRRRAASSAWRGLAASALALASACAWSEAASTTALIQPAGPRRLGVERLAEQQIFARPRAAEALRREQRRACFRHQAEIDERMWKRALGLA